MTLSTKPRIPLRRSMCVAASVGVTTLALVMPAGAAVNPGDWAQQGGSPGLTSAIRSPGELSPATVRDLGLEFSAPTKATGPISVAGGVVYSTSEDGVIYAMSAANGHTLWSQDDCGFDAPAVNVYADAPPAVSGNAVWVVDGRYLTKISTVTHFQTGCVDLGPVTGVFGGGGPVLSGSAVYVAQGRRVFAVDQASASVNWSVTLPKGGATATAAVDGGLVFVAATSAAYQGGWVYALDALDGHVVWSYHQKRVATTVTVSGGRVFLGNGPTALDEATGAVLWTAPGFALTDTGVSVAGSQVDIYGGETCESPHGNGCEGVVFSFDAATGHLLWQRSITDEGSGVPTVGAGVVFVTDAIDFGQIFVLKSSTGAVVTKLVHPGGEYVTQPVVVDGEVYAIAFVNSGPAVLDRWGL